MRMVDLIHKKREGCACTPTEIDFIVQGYSNGTIPDYQMSSWLMAVCLQGMNSEETSQLTMAMVNSGKRMDLSGIPGIKVDKHSTGGVGDKVSLIVAPVLASLGIPVAKMSGRGLGHTGGTIDKLEAIPGFCTELSREQFLQGVAQVNLAITAQSMDLAPADKKIYALRDVTATVDSIPLIASSIMSKKIAAGADAIVLDVKVGRGAFMKSLEQARELAHTMVDIGEQCKRRTIAIITDMQQPLGYAIGNANEVREAIEVLQGQGEADLTEVCTHIAAYMAIAGGAFRDFAQAYPAIQHQLASGQALATFRSFVASQGGQPAIVEHPELLPQSKYRIDVFATRTGYIDHIDAELAGIAAMMLGAGRMTKEDVIQHAVGINLVQKVGSYVEVGQPLCTLLSNERDVAEVEEKVRAAFHWSDTRPERSRLIHEVVGT